VPSSPPRDVTVTQATHDVNSVRVTWRHPRHANGNITGDVMFLSVPLKRNDSVQSATWRLDDANDAITMVTQ
jgi:hypothetical protein